MNNESTKVKIIYREQRRKQGFWLAVLEFEKSNETEWKLESGLIFLRRGDDTRQIKEGLFCTRQ